LVAVGILFSRLFGLVRQKLFAHWFGNGLEAAAFNAATRIPNILQNLLGEGVLSASFIPVYAGLRASARDEEARRVAGAVFGCLCLLVGLVVAAGISFAAPLVHLIAPGYQGHTFDLTVELVRIIFPGTGVLVLSAWCLGVLNSHRRFFLSYVAPVVWNGAIIAALIGFRGHSQGIVWVAWATVVGSVLQFAVQLPNVLALLGRFDPRPSLALSSVRQVATSFFPAVASRGVVQVSAYVDLALATLVSARAVSVLTYTQAIALLPVSLFGMSVSAAELPEMSADAARNDGQQGDAVRRRLESGLSRMAFFVIPSAAAFLFLGDVLCCVLLESGKFTAKDSRLGWYVLIGSGVALFAQTRGRLFSSALFAFKDTQTPLRYAMIRVGVGVGLGWCGVTQLPRFVDVPPDLSVVFVSFATSVSAWVEMTLLRRAVVRRLPGQELSPEPLWPVIISATLAAALAVATKACLTFWFGARSSAVEEWGGSVIPFPDLPRVSFLGVDVSGPLGSVFFLAVFGVAFLVTARWFGVPQTTRLLGSLRGRQT
jgi:putative peptidoglycan lipid II flippase